MEHPENKRLYLLTSCSLSPFLKRHHLKFNTPLIEQFFISDSTGRLETFIKIGNRYYRLAKEANGKKVHQETLDKTVYRENRKRLSQKPIKKMGCQFHYQGSHYRITSFRGFLKGLNLLEVVRPEMPASAEQTDETFYEPLRPLILTDVTENPDFCAPALFERQAAPTLSSGLETQIQQITANGDFFKAPPALSFSPFESSAEALKAVFFLLVRQAQDNADAILLGDHDPERVHQWRIALRKMRAVLSKFAPLFDNAWRQQHKQTLADLMQQSNAVRDEEVFAEKMDDFKTLLPAKHHAGLDSLRQTLQSHAQQQHQALIDTLKSTRFQQEMRELERFSQSDENVGLSSEAQQPLIFPLKKVLQHTYRTILIKGAKLDQNSSDEAYHKVRIEAKKFRYSLELFSSTMEADSHQKLLQALKKIQNLLGEHQDLTVELSYIETLTKEDGQLEKATQKSLKALTPTLEKLKRQQRKKFAKQFKKFAKSRSTFRKMICRY